MTDQLGPLHADGERVWVASATEADVEASILATEQSRQRLGEWNPVDPYGLPALISAASRYHRTLLIHAREPEGNHDLVGKINVTNVVLGRAMAGTLGYDAFDPYAGRGLFVEGLRLTVGLAFTPEPQGMGLHRLEANVQPGNVRSAAVLRALGFRREGFSPAYLLMPGADGRDEWRDHDRYAVTAGEWPAASADPPAPRRVAVVVNGVSGSGKTELAGRLARELGVPLLSTDTVREAVTLGPGPASVGAGASIALWSLLRDSPVGGVVEGRFSPDHRAHLVEGLTSAGFDPATTPEVWCDRDGADWTAVPDAARPSGVGPVLSVDTSHHVTDRDLVTLALRARATQG